MKLLLIGIITFSFFALTFTPAYALDSVPVGPCSSERFGTLCTAPAANNPGILVRNAIIAALIIAAVLSLFFMVFGGFKWITSTGDKTKVDEARKMIVAAIVGLILTLLSYFILSIVLGLFGISLSNLSIPSLSGKKPSPEYCSSLGTTFNAFTQTCQ